MSSTHLDASLFAFKSIKHIKSSYESLHFIAYIAFYPFCSLSIIPFILSCISHSIHIVICISFYTSHSLYKSIHLFLSIVFYFFTFYLLLKLVDTKRPTDRRALSLIEHWSQLKRGEGALGVTNSFVLLTSYYSHSN